VLAATAQRDAVAGPIAFRDPGGVCHGDIPPAVVSFEAGRSIDQITDLPRKIGKSWKSEKWGSLSACLERGLMPSFAAKSISAQPAPSARVAMPNLAVRRPQEESVERGRTNGSGFAPSGHDFNFGRIPIHARTPPQTQPQLEMSTPGDAFEREADSVASQVMRMSEPHVQCSCASGDKCPKCSAEQKEQEVQRQATDASSPSASVPLSSPVHDAVRTSGQPLDPGTRSFMEPRFGHDFSRVRIHTEAQAEASAAALNARAYTLGNRIVFAAGQYAPSTASGRHLIAHELTHVIQQGSNQPLPMRQVAPPTQGEEQEERDGGMEVGGGVSQAPVPVFEHSGMRVSRDLAVPPTVADPAEPVLTEEQIQAAIRYNGFRFKDPYSLAVVRDFVGVSRFPAVSDEDLARGVARYQASNGLPQDGQVGPATTARLVQEAGAENLPKDAEQLRADNYVTWSPPAGVHNGCAAGLDAGGLATFFQWDVNFNTSLRNGWIVQEIVNVRNRTNCAGAAIPETLTPHYWEAWFVDGRGNVLVPTAINPARTRATATAVPAPAHDLWRRASAAPSRGNWSMSAQLFTCLRLPAGFAAGNVHDALALPSTAAAPNADDLGQPEASRRAGGAWNCCGAPGTHFHNPA